MPVDKTPWTDETVMPWGAHKGKKLKDLDASYLLWLLEQRWIRDWPGLHAYLKKNEDLLLEEKREGKEEDEDFPEENQSYEDFQKDFRGF